MRYVKQVIIIFGVTCVGEAIKSLVPLPIPGSIYGLIIMLGLLITRTVKLESVREVGDFLVDFMPLMFIPAAVGLITCWGQIKSILVPISVIIVTTTFLVMIATGKTTDALLKRQGGKKRT